MLIITDGADNASRLRLKDAIRRVQGLGGPVVYTIGLLFDTDRNESDRAKNDLETLSQETGGIAFFPRSLQEVDAIAADVARDIREQYVVAYHSSRPFSIQGYRTVRVEAAGPESWPAVRENKTGILRTIGAVQTTFGSRRSNNDWDDIRAFRSSRTGLTRSTTKQAREYCPQCKRKSTSIIICTDTAWPW